MHASETFIPYEKFNQRNGLEIETLNGTFSTIKSWKYNGINVAAKISQSKQLSVAEVQKHQYFYCNNVINLYGITKLPNGTDCLIMHYAKCGNLHDYLSEKKLEWDEMLKMSIDIAAGLLECHSREIIHLNINSENILVDKNENILVDKNLELKIAGFGFDINKEFDNIETVRWAAPERFSEKPEMKKEMQKLSDIYSYGLVVWEIAMNGKNIIFSCRPYDGMEIDEIKDTKASGDISYLSEASFRKGCIRTRKLALRKSLEKLQNDPKELALFYFKEEMYDALVHHLTNLLKDNGRDAFVLQYRGAAYYNLKKYEESILDLKKANYYKPKDPFTLKYFGAVYRAKYQYEKSFRDLTEKLVDEKKFANSLRQHGGTFYNMKRYKDSFTYFDTSLDIEPEDVFALSHRASIYRLFFKKFEKALADLDRALEIDPNYVFALSEREETYQMMHENNNNMRSFKKSSSLPPFMEDSTGTTLKVDKKWHTILGEEIPLIEPQYYAKLCKIISPPKLSSNEIHGSVTLVLPYILQKEQKKIQLSRFDCIASLFASAECTVIKDIFKTLSQFPMAFPLVTPELKEAAKFRVMHPLFTGPVIKWESEPGKIIENHLFQDPFHMIVAIRIGTNTPGKSTILNQLMKRNFMFSSPNEPGAEYGMPHMISGSIEFTWLTEETCGVGLWTEVLRNFYKEKKNKIVLLANLHGDALNYPDQVNFLRQFPSSFLVFLMPGYDDNQKNNLNELTGNKKSVYCWINQKNKPKYSFDTTLLTNDRNLKKMRMMINEALELDTSNKALDLNDSTFDISKLKLEGTLRFTEEIEFLESRHLIDFIQEKNCRHIKLEVMQLQQTPKDGFSIIQNNRELKDLISLFVNTLMLPLDKRRRALAHIEREISKLSSKESSNAREKAISKRDELRKISVGNKANEKKVKNEIAKIWEEINNISLGLEHFFRELGQFYKFTSVYDRMADIIDRKADIMKLPELCAELLISGDAIELLDGDAGTIPETWFSAICKHVDKLYPKLKIFVISILGLQSSGKSTLLNALFACRFAVSVGRCTRGLFMRLLFLEEDLAQEIGVDAFVLIDTEGLGAPEKMDEPEAEKKDRILATFAMGVSNLTILNVLGEATRDLTEILQIVIVTMARLEKADMAPDILMVQHVSERNIAKLTEPEEKFRNALQEALKITDKQDTRMGIYSMKCLQTLEERIKDGKLLIPFRPFKDGATAHAPPSGQYHDDVVNLYKSILVDCKNSNNKIEFAKWYSLIQDYWSAVSHDDFAVQFKNIKKIYEFIELGDQITKVKEAIDSSFFEHEDHISQKFLELISDDKENQNIKDECIRMITKELKDVPCYNYEKCEKCMKTNEVRENLDKYLEENKKDEICKNETHDTIEKYIEQNRNSSNRKLTQKLEASIIRKGLSSDFFEIINRKMEEIINNIQGKNLSDQEREKKVEEIWIALRNHLASRDNVIPVTQQIDEEVGNEFSKTRSSFINEYKKETRPDLSKRVAYKNYFKQHYLDVKDVSELKNILDSLTDKILEKRKSPLFYDGIVRDLRKEIDNTLDEFSKKLEISLITEFKWDVYLYALKVFKQTMTNHQNKWNKEHSPLSIFYQKKDEHKKLIDTRLRHGFSLVSEGQIIGDYLVKAIHKKAMKMANRKKIDSVKNVGWMNGPETVRLKYFRMLAEQVYYGNKEKAISHFRYPRSIESWFEAEVNSIKSNPEPEYNKTYESEFDLVRQEIRNCRSSEKIKNYVNNYMTNANVDYEVDLRNLKDNDNKLCAYIEDRLNNYNRPIPERFMDASDDESIMKMLGCTETCYWCGALCWGSRGHHEHKDETRKHHTSHQPTGLGGTRRKDVDTLVAEQCHQWTEREDQEVWYRDKLTKWSVVKADHFSDWIFEKHNKNQFNNLKRWFFERLHHDLAKHYNVNPATDDELRNNNCTGLNYVDIISALDGRIK
ncbi:22151_t:CDS:10 [Cetraspora pellucida]|uniref:22151_t:CDS:1 n=1 Tax=Cetraspora pellucida TaxID=1433469 RepID=A0A9N8ZVJ1_9GLOM|nr:22151_t:CDS:10 [Cetraspora pellucida]